MKTRTRTELMARVTEAYKHAEALDGFTCGFVMEALREIVAELDDEFGSQWSVTSARRVRDLATQILVADEFDASNRIEALAAYGRAVVVLTRHARI